MPQITSVSAQAYRIPTDQPEQDGTLDWDSTTLVVVTIQADRTSGLGYTYCDRSAAGLINGMLGTALIGQDALDVPALWMTAIARVRNLGLCGIAAMAIAAVDTALWDLKARLLHQSVSRLLGLARVRVPVYGSGGFTNYDDQTMDRQLDGWLSEGITAIKVKIGRSHARDAERLRRIRGRLPASVQLMADANGGYTRKQAQGMAQVCVDVGVGWFEEPVPAADPHGLHQVRMHAGASVEIAAGEYGYTLQDFRTLIAADAVDVLQADATRCLGFSGFLQVGALCLAHHLPLSSHCAPFLHLQVACSVPALRHIEYFHDHVRIERRYFDGCAAVVDGCLRPDPDAPGLGLEFKSADAHPFLI